MNSILLKQMKLRASFSAIKPFLTQAQRERRLAWAVSHRFWGRSRWRRYLFADETYFKTKTETGGRLVRREPGSSRHDPRYTRTKFKHPEKLMAWCGITAEGERVLHFLPPNAMMTGARYAKALEESGAVRMMRKSNLLLYHDNATPHQAVTVNDVLRRGGVRSKFSPGTSASPSDIECYHLKYIGEQTRISPIFKSQDYLPGMLGINRIIFQEVFMHYFPAVFLYFCSMIPLNDPRLAPSPPPIFAKLLLENVKNTRKTLFK